MPTLITFAPKNLAGFTAMNWYLREPFEEAFIFHHIDEIMSLRTWVQDFQKKIAPKRVSLVQISQQESLVKLFTNARNPDKILNVKAHVDGITFYVKQVVQDYSLDPRPEFSFYNFQLLFSGDWVSDKWIVDVTNFPTMLIGNLIYYAIKLVKVKLPIVVGNWDNQVGSPVYYPTIFPDKYELIFLNLIGRGVESLPALAVQFAKIMNDGISSEKWSLKLIKNLVNDGLVSETTEGSSLRFKLTDLGKATYQPATNKI